jgi:hypothetical protein
MDGRAIVYARRAPILDAAAAERELRQACREVTIQLFVPPMNFTRLVLAALGAFVAYVALGALFFTRPAMRTEFMKYPAVYRTQEAMKPVMPIGMLGMFASILALAALFALIHPAGAEWSAGLVFGALVALFAVGSFVLHNHVNLNIGARLSAYQALAYVVEWLAVGVIIALIYRGPGS